jgi:general secretion pathway protein K
MRPQQSGIALITAILVVALASIAAAAILTSSNIAIHRTATLQDTEKAWWYASGVETWVKSILERDSDLNQTDSLKDVWAQPVDYLPTDEGFLRGAVTDLSGRYNLNNLGVQDPQAFQKQVEIWTRLLANLEMTDGFRARGLASAIRDWIDADSEPTGFDGAEDSEYLGVSPPYRVANRPMTSVSELLAIKGMDRELYARLREVVAALPQDGVAINVNTAPPAVLRALAVRPGPELEVFERERIEKPAESIQELESRNVFGAQDAPREMMAVRSQFFMVRAEAFVGSGRIALYSFIYRPDQGIPAVYGRSVNTE